MRLFKCSFWAVVVFLFFLAQGAVLAAEGTDAPRSDPDVDFHWAFAAMSSVNGKTAVQAVTQDMALKSGDQLKMMVEPRKKCFVYLFHHNPKDGLKLLFPYTLQQFEMDYQVNRKYYIPRGEAWFKLDKNTGQETFYLVASAARLDDLEKDYVRYESAGPADKPDAGRAVLDRIRALRREHREFTAPAERPVPIGGAVRGVQPVEDPARADVAALAGEIASTGFIARTYTIEHK
ncbi:MAG: DUF4384 domain-containing protein [Syntrophobacteraceae bacterium]